MEMETSTGGTPKGLGTEASVGAHRAGRGRSLSQGPLVSALDLQLEAGHGGSRQPQLQGGRGPL